MSKTRGFEYVSREQLEKDLKIKITKEDYEKMLPEKPKRGSKLSAGYDIFAVRDFKLEPNNSITLPSYLKVYMPDLEWLLVAPRSGSGFKYEVQLANTIGVIDADYHNNAKNEGHMWVKIVNRGHKTWNVKKGEGIAQAIFLDYRLTDDDIAEAERVGGFGSTSK